MHTCILLCSCELTHLPRAPSPQVCTKAPAQQQYCSQNLMEIVHCFIALGEAPSPSSALPAPLLWLRGHN